jgi:D-alanine-D-alanine ligase
MSGRDASVGPESHVANPAPSGLRIAVVANINRGGHWREIEFDIPETISAICAALGTRHQPVALECHRNVGEWVTALLRIKPDLIFSTAEGFGRAAREAFYPALYEELGLSYCGSDPTTMLITHNKKLTKDIVERHGVRTPRACIATTPLEIGRVAALSYPVIVKPNSEGSSIGITDESIVHDPHELLARLDLVWAGLGNVALVEEFINGVDVSMTFIEGLGDGQGIFGPVAFYPETTVFDSNAKSPHSPRSVMSFNMGNHRDIVPQLRWQMRVACRALDIRGYGRADFRIAEGGACYFLEMNAQAEFKPTRSDLLAPVEREGFSYDEIVLHIADRAWDTRRLPSIAGIAPLERARTESSRAISGSGYSAEARRGEQKG